MGKELSLKQQVGQLAKQVEGLEENFKEFATAVFQDGFSIEVEDDGALSAMSNFNDRLEVIEDELRVVKGKGHGARPSLAPIVERIGRLEMGMAELKNNQAQMSSKIADLQHQISKLQLML